MAVTVIPTTTYAMEEFENDYEFSPDEVSIEYEIESKRTENSKTYLTKDGGYYQVSAAVPIHEDLDGKWETIFYKGIMPSEKVLDLPMDCNTLTGSVNL